MIQSNETGRLEYDKTRVIKSQADRIKVTEGIRSQGWPGRFDLCPFALKRLTARKHVTRKLGISMAWTLDIEYVHILIHCNRLATTLHVCSTVYLCIVGVTLIQPNLESWKSTETNWGMFKPSSLCEAAVAEDVTTKAGSNRGFFGWAVVMQRHPTGCSIEESSRWNYIAGVPCFPERWNHDSSITFTHPTRSRPLVNLEVKPGNTGIG